MKKIAVELTFVLVSYMTLASGVHPAGAVNSVAGDRQPVNFSSVGSSALAQQRGTQQDILNAYFNAGYGYCDAQMLGTFWGITPADAKLRAGKGLLGYRGFLTNISSKLTRSRQLYAGRNVCSYNSDFSYEDAVAVAAYWQVPVSQAKARLTAKLESGNLRTAKQEVAQANRSRRQTTTPSANYQTEVLNAYFNAGYGYCDAQMLGAFWGINPADAKMRAGKGLLGYPGYLPNIASKLTRSRQLYSGRNVCSYNSDFSYQDAVAVAKYWRVPISRAKTILTSKLESGNLKTAKRVVAEANRRAGRR